MALNDHEWCAVAEAIVILETLQPDADQPPLRDLDYQQVLDNLRSMRGPLEYSQCRFCGWPKPYTEEACTNCHKRDR